MPTFESFSAAVVDAVSRAIGLASGTVLLHGPSFPPAANKYVQECVTTGWVSSAGAFVTRFEEQLAAYTGAARAVAVVNGTAALEICLRLAGVNPGDEVLAPSLTFVATANAISHAGAVPHFVDVCDQRLAVCPDSLTKHLESVASVNDEGKTINRDSGRRIAALCVMHCFGHPADLNALQAVCDRFGIVLVEDAAESLGSWYQARHTGRYGRLAAVSFNGNKILTTGGGGAILTDDQTLADRAKHLTTTGKLSHAWEFHHDCVAWNYRMPNLNAALGVAQMECFETTLEQKRRLAEAYFAAFEGVDGVEVIREPGDSRSNYWLNTLRLTRGGMSERGELLEALNRAGYQSRPIWQPMHQLPMYSGCPRAALPRTEQLQQRLVNVPSSAFLAQ